MELMILKNVSDNMKEAFVKLEDNCRLTVGFVGEKGRYAFVSDCFYEFSHRPVLYIEGNTLPRDCGIFLIEDDKAYTMCFSGDLNQVKNRLKNYTVFDEKANVKIKAPNSENTHENELLEPNSIVEMPVETNDLDEKAEPEYKSTGYVLPDDFLAPPEKTPESFWDCNEEKFNELFKNNPENKNLTGLIPGSKWVNVEADGYVLGIIYDENNLPMYICYGFPLPWGEEPPEKLEGYCQWIPIDCTRPHDDGYWVIYINAKTGERIK